MDPLDFLEPEELLLFLHRHKTELSCMENLHTFLSQLRDHNLIPEDRYKKMSRMKSKDNMKKALYDHLDWLEREKPQHIKLFWDSVFKETIMNHYPTLRLLRNRLMDGSFHFDIKLPEKVEQKEGDKGDEKKLSEDEEEEKEQQSAKKKKKLTEKRVRGDNEEEEERADRTPTPRKKSKKILFSPALKKGEKSSIWTWPIYKLQLPVICGQQEGILNRDRLAKGEKCIVVKNQWFTPSEFEKLAGKQSSKNWKLSIRCRDVPLQRLLQEGHLKSFTYKGSSKNARKSLFPSDAIIDVIDEEDPTEEEEAEQEPGCSHDGRNKVFKVTCGASTGTFHVKRFASGTRGKSIRTETNWMTPMEFAQEASGQPEASWKKDIEWEGKPLCDLTERILTIHSLLCSCELCKPDSEDTEAQKNDDECFVCKGEEGHLVVCDGCPRSFHQKCHLPHVEDAALGNNRVWMCTFCVFKSCRECFYQDELRRGVALSRRISQHMLECQYLVLRLCSADDDLQNSSSVTKIPGRLGGVADKLQKQLYQTVGQFASDVQLVFTDRAPSDRDDAELLADSNTLKTLFDQEFDSVFNIRD